MLSDLPILVCCRCLQARESTAAFKARHCLACFSSWTRCFIFANLFGDCSSFSSNFDMLSGFINFLIEISSRFLLRKSDLYFDIVGCKLI